MAALPCHPNQEESSEKLTRVNVNRQEYLEVTDFIFRLSVCFPAPQITATVSWAAKGLLGALSPARSEQRRRRALLAALAALIVRQAS